MTNYKISNLREDVKGVYAEVLDGKLNRLLTLIEQEEQVRGQEPVFNDASEAIEHVSSLLGQYREPVKEFLGKTLEIKTLLPQIFSGAVEENPKTESSINASGERRVSIYQEFHDALEKEGLKGKELEKKARSCAAYYIRKSEIRGFIRIDGRVSWTREYSTLRKNIRAIARNIASKK